jgi:UDP-glucose 4-epimerase
LSQIGRIRDGRPLRGLIERGRERDVEDRRAPGSCPTRRFGSLATYLVTGGCGFIGSHLADGLIARGHGVRILDDLSTGRVENKPSSAELIVGDIADGALVERAIDGVDGCFHLAAIGSVERSNREWLPSHRTNLTGAITVFDRARAARSGAPVPVVYASSAAVYGDNPALPLAEDAAPRPLSAYGADKLGCELHARVAALVHRVPTLGLRFFNVYGPRQDPGSPYSGVISIFCDRLQAGQDVTIFGGGEQTRDFVYVGDAVAGMLAGMAVISARQEGVPGVLNLCTGHATTINGLVRVIAELCGAQARIRGGPARIGEIAQSIGDPRLARRYLGISAVTPLAAGLALTLAAQPSK